MSFYANLRYQFPLPTITGRVPQVDGSVLSASAMPSHQLLRRRITKKHAHLSKRIFDPQLYLSGLDAGAQRKTCAYLASYGWFCVQGLIDYDSNRQDQKTWKDEAEEKIGTLWPGHPPTDVAQIRDATRDCIDMQLRLGCEWLVIPSPLTAYAGTDYSDEVAWLDAACAYHAELRKHSAAIPPLMATVALGDICAQYANVVDPSLIHIVADAIGAREIEGAYIVLEQGGQPSAARHCADSKALSAILQLVHLLTEACGLAVYVNYLGQFGLACEAAGASAWVSNWYKSEYRLRLGDKVGAGRSRPTYWSNVAAVDISLNDEFDRLVSQGGLDAFEDRTLAAEGLLDAARRGTRSAALPDWENRISNVRAAREHYLRSCVNAERRLQMVSESSRLSHVQAWLEEAQRKTIGIERQLGSQAKTNTDHVICWLNALKDFRSTQSL